MSLEAFITGKSSLTSSGGLVPNQNSTNNEQQRRASVDEESSPTNYNNNSVAMAERTSNLINSYKSYIDSNDEEFMMLGDRITGQGGSDNGDDAIDNNSSNDIKVSFTSTNTTTTSSNNKDSLILRDFGSPTTQSQLTLDNDLWETSSDESCNGKLNRRNNYHYTHPIYHSKRFKIVTLSIIAIAAIIGGISISNKSKKEAALPNWNEELEQLHQDEMLAKANNSNSQKDTAANYESEINDHYYDKKSEDQLAEKTTSDSSAAASTMIKDVIQHKEDTAASVMIDKVIQHKDTTDEQQQTEDFWDTVAPIEDAAHSAGIETITRHVLCCSSKPPSTSTSTLDPKKTRSNIKSTTQEAENGYETAEQYHPTWYNRNDGWEGSTYSEALAFCNAVVDGSGKTGELCPYEVYCPTGPHHIPLGGYHTGQGEEPGSNSLEGTSSRSPIANYPNGWVQVGSENSCVQYTILNNVNDHERSEDKETTTDEFLNMEIEQIDNAILDNVLSNKARVDGEEGDKAEDTLPSSFQVNEQEQLVSNHYVPIQVVHNDDESQSSIPESMIPVIHHEDTTVQVVQQQQPGPSDNFDMASILHEKYKPIWLSSNEGWKGGSHDDAVQFCSSIRDKQLCPYSAMCPHGPGHAVMGGRHQLTFTTTGEQYAPVMGGSNHWVYIGTKDDERSATCMTHRQLEGSSPSWGLNSERSEVKQHIMCCTVN